MFWLDHWGRRRLYLQPSNWVHLLQYCAEYTLRYLYWSISMWSNYSSCLETDAERSVSQDAFRCSIECRAVGVRRLGVSSTPPTWATMLTLLTDGVTDSYITVRPPRCHDDILWAFYTENKFYESLRRVHQTVIVNWSSLRDEKTWTQLRLQQHVGSHVCKQTL